MDGSIDVESELGKGSTFTVILPLKIMQQSEKKNHESSDVLDCIEDKTKANLDIQQNYISLMSSMEERSKHNDAHHDETSQIIVAEGTLKLIASLTSQDNPINRKVVSKMIVSLGFGSPTLVADGRELVEKFDISRHKVVITDMVS